MQPIHELLSRIRWDRNFAAAEFVVGYYDRVEERIIRVPFAFLEFSADDHFSFELVGREGERHSIPYHRVREVLRNGRCIWQRDAHLPHKGEQGA